MNRYCFWWSTTDHIAWPTANWTWSDCEIVSDCIRWGIAGSWWKNANWQWSQCSSSFIPPPTPSGQTASLHPLGIDATTLVQPWLNEPWNPYRAGEDEEKQKRLIRLICKVKGQKFDEEKEWKKFKVTADDIKLVVKTVSGIDLDLKMEN